MERMTSTERAESKLRVVVRKSCYCLRWKGTLDDAEDSPFPDSDEGFFWCSQTRSYVGPDGRMADEDVCTDGRKCFERL